MRNSEKASLASSLLSSQRQKGCCPSSAWAPFEGTVDLQHGGNQAGSNMILEELLFFIYFIKIEIGTMHSSGNLGSN